MLLLSKSGFTLGPNSWDDAGGFRYFCLMKHLLFGVLLLLGMRAGAQNIAGIGAQLIMDTTGGWSMPRIFSLVQGSPAWDSLRATDYIISVNGTSCRDKKLEDIVALIRGEVGTAVVVVTANTKDGEGPRSHTLVRVGMNIPRPADPKDAFYADCATEVKALKKTGAVIVKTFNSDCGNFFFNFDGMPGLFHIRIMMMAPAGSKYTATARAFDNDNEAAGTDLGLLDAAKASNGMAVMNGAVSFKRDCVGTIGITMKDDARQCGAMYVVVYR